MTERNRRFVLASRPVGAPTLENFRLEEVEKPLPQKGEVLLRTIYLSLDPYMRGRMSDRPSYAKHVELDEIMVGTTVCKVEESLHPDYQKVDWVLGNSGWQDYALSDGSDLTLLDEKFSRHSYALGIQGMLGFTAHVGLLDIGKPKEGDTLVVAAATGAVGSAVGRIGKLKGYKVVGFAGGLEKCKYAKDVLGFDAYLHHRSEGFATQLKQVCSNGIDIYFENVGGKVFDSVLPLLNVGARIPAFGLISMYNATEMPNGPDQMSRPMAIIIIKRIKVQGFIVFDHYGPRFDQFTQEMSGWLKTGQILYREHLVEGVEKAPHAFIDMLEGQNFGKGVIKVNTILSGPEMNFRKYMKFIEEHLCYFAFLLLFLKNTLSIGSFKKCCSESIKYFYTAEI